MPLGIGCLDPSGRILGGPEGQADPGSPLSALISTSVKWAGFFQEAAAGVEGTGG